MNGDGWCWLGRACDKAYCRKRLPLTLEARIVYEGRMVMLESYADECEKAAELAKQYGSAPNPWTMAELLEKALEKAMEKDAKAKKGQA